MARRTRTKFSATPATVATLCGTAFWPHLAPARPPARAGQLSHLSSRRQLLHKRNTARARINCPYNPHIGLKPQTRDFSDVKYTVISLNRFVHWHILTFTSTFSQHTRVECSQKLDHDTVFAPSPVHLSLRPSIFVHSTGKTEKAVKTSL